MLCSIRAMTPFYSIFQVVSAHRNTDEIHNFSTCTCLGLFKHGILYLFQDVVIVVISLQK